MRWHFYYPKRTSFYPADYENPGLGGSETSLVLLARALAARGHDVEVFNCCYRPGRYDGVAWRMAWELEESPTPDVAVAVRFDEALWPPTVKAGRRLFWMLDDRTRGPSMFADASANLRDTVIPASLAMLRRLEEDGVNVATQLIPLPVETHRYSGSVADRGNICLYSSMPNRGLDVALAVWPRIRAHVPDAELWVTGGWQLWGFTNAEAEDRWQQYFGGHAMPNGVHILGARPRSELVAIQQQAAVTLYPCRFPEMFCLSAAESAAAGTPVITSAIHALTERVEHNRTGILIPGAIDRASVQDAFVHAATELLTDAPRREAMAAAAIRSSRPLATDLVAAAWEGV